MVYLKTNNDVGKSNKEKETTALDKKDKNLMDKECNKFEAFLTQVNVTDEFHHLSDAI